MRFSSQLSRSVACRYMNPAVMDRQLAATIEADFFEDLEQSCKLGLSNIEQNTLWEETSRRSTTS
jgi:hypothetical protein